MNAFAAVASLWKLQMTPPCGFAHLQKALFDLNFISPTATFILPTVANQMRIRG